MKQILRSKMVYISLLMLLALGMYDISMAVDASKSSLEQFLIMLEIVPPIFVLIGLLDVFVPRETMIKLMGDDSKFLGIIIAFVFGTLAAGPLVGAFPLAMIMLKKGARYANVLFFMMIWASAKLPIIFFQVATLGIKYTAVSNLVLIIIFLIGSYLIERLLGKKEINIIKEKANSY